MVARISVVVARIGAAVMVQLALERAQAPVQKKTGKPVMFRSHVTRKKKTGSEVVKKNDEEAELEAFLNRVS